MYCVFKWEWIILNWKKTVFSDKHKIEHFPAMRQYMRKQLKLMIKEYNAKSIKDLMATSHRDKKKVESFYAIEI